MLADHFHKGINLGGWLSQYEIIARLPLNKEILEEHFETFITEQDLKQIFNWGFDHVRLPVSGYFLYEKDMGQLNPVALHYIDKCIAWCRKYGLNIILDLHDLWGNVYGAMDTPMPLLTEDPLKENFYCIWEELAKYYKDVNDICLMFELLNEVSDASGYLWNRMYKEAVQRIRKYDKERFILIGSNFQNSTAYLSQLDIMDDPNVFYNFHYYEPQVFTHQKAHFSEEMREFNRTVTYPGNISDFVEFLAERPEYQMKYALVSDEKMNDKALMDKLLKDVSNFVEYSDRQLYCGEFGVIDSTPAVEAVKWMKDFIETLESQGVGHALWNYKALDFGLIDLEGKVVSDVLLEGVIESNRF